LEISEGRSSSSHDFGVGKKVVRSRSDNNQQTGEKSGLYLRRPAQTKLEAVAVVDYF